MSVSLLRVKEEKMKSWLHAHALYSVHRLRRKKNWERKWKKIFSITECIENIIIEKAMKQQQDVTWYAAARLVDHAAQM